MKSLTVLLLALSLISSGLAQYHLDFNGSNSYVSFSDNAVYNQTEFTVELWVMAEDISSSYSSLVGENNCFEFGFHQNKIHAWVEGTSSGGSHLTKSLYSTDASELENEWHHIALVADGSSVKIYLDGEVVASSSFSVVNYKSTGTEYDLKIGAYVFDNSRKDAFQGQMDEVRIWSKALSAEDIRMAMCQEIENDNGTVKGSYTNEVSTSGLDWTNDLKCYYTMNNSVNALWDAHYPFMDGTLNNIAGMSREAETTPLPYQSVKNGTWSKADCWESNQVVPQNKWAIVEIAHKVKVKGQANARYINVLSGKSLSINGEKELTVTDKIHNDGQIKIKEHASLVQLNVGNDINSGSGTYDVIRSGNTSELAYNIWSSPIKSANIISTFSGVNPCDVYMFNASAQNWKYDYPSGYSTTCNGSNVTFSSSDVIQGGDGIMNQGIGYFIPGNASASEKKFTGTVNNGDLTVQVKAANNPGGVSWYGDNWNLLGNPYPSALSLDINNPNSFVNKNASAITGDVYFWVDDASSGAGYNASSDYAVYNATGGVSANGSDIPDGNIASGQGFWVIASATQDVMFDNSMRVAGNNKKFFKQEDHPKIWLDLTNDQNQINQILIGLTDNSSRGYDMGFDAPKADGNATINFASVADEELYAIQAVPAVNENDSTGVELYINAGNIGVHFISLAQMENLSEEYDLFLLDKEYGKVHDLSSGPFSFYVAQAGEFKERFYLQVNRKTALHTSIAEQTDRLNQKIRIGKDGDIVLIDGIDALVDLNDISVFSLQGKLVKSIKGSGMSASWDASNVASGMYTLLINTSKGAVSKKVIIE